MPILEVINRFYKCILGPKLFRIYHRAGSNTVGQVYEGNSFESLGNFAVSYLIPACVIYCVWQPRPKYFIYLAIFIISTYAVRALGRAASPTYQSFLQILTRAQRNFNTENAELLRRYDFEFNAWPVSFKSNKISNYSASGNRGESSTLCWLVGWVVAHSFGIRLVYPGLLIERLVRVPIEEGRAKYVVEQNGIRSKVETSDGNKIDTMFFDRRSEINPKGKTLVITFEGNAGFYEIGMLCTPLESGYSVLGWNHPGFSGSSGTPYPPNELNAAEAVFDYATSILGFKEEEIILYAWSIGGFPASHIASSHPKVKGVVLDATFDDIMVLALPRMPAFLSGIVRSTIRNHMDLHISKEIRGYKGPIRLVRRTEDEIISDPPTVLSHNRGNYLLMDILRQRFSYLMNVPEAEKSLKDWLAKPHIIEPHIAAARNYEPLIPDSTVTLTPEEKSRLVIQIAEKLLTDYKSSHCVPLPPSYFQLPWAGPSSTLPSTSKKVPIVL